MKSEGVKDSLPRYQSVAPPALCSFPIKNCQTLRSRGELHDSGLSSLQRKELHLDKDEIKQSSDDDDEYLIDPEVTPTAECGRV